MEIGRRGECRKKGIDGTRRAGGIPRGKEGCGRLEWPILQPPAVIRIEFSVPSGQVDRKRDHDDESNFRT